jgi:cytochrome c oxidase assembly protein subunit 15
MPAEAEASAARLRLMLARMALAAAALTFVVIVASAFMRHVQAGLSCGDWPACYAQAVTPDADAVPGTGVRVARIAHRIAATGVLALVLGMLLMAWTQTPAWKREGALALCALVIAVALAVLGIATPGARLPAITLGNLLGGYAMLAVLAAATAPASTASRGARSVARVALLFVFVQTALGGMIGAQFASLACPALTDCGAWSWTAFVDGESWNPLRAPALIDGHLTAGGGAAGLHVLHRLNGLAVGTLVLTTAAIMWHTRPRLAWALTGLLVAAAVSGVAAVASQPALPVVVAHNACAALLVATLARAGEGANRRWASRCQERAVDPYDQ